MQRRASGYIGERVSKMELPMETQKSFMTVVKDMQMGDVTEEEAGMR